MSSAALGSHGSSKQQFSSGIPGKLIVSLFAIPTLLALFGYLFTYPASYENTRAFLRTLIQAESSVIAIVFSVIFLGVQVISSRYTTRMGKLFFRDKLMQFTILILTITIAVDLLLLYVLPEVIGQVYVAALYFSVGLSIIAFYSLYLSIRRMIESSTPEGVIYTSKNLTNYSDFVKSCKRNGLSGPPTRGLFSFTTASLSENERVTSKIAFEEYIGLINQIFREFLERGEAKELTRSEIESGFQPIFTQQLTSIYLVSESTSNKYIQREVIACYRQLTILFHEETDVLQIAANGFSELVVEGGNSSLVFNQYFALVLDLVVKNQFHGSRLFVSEARRLSADGHVPDQTTNSAVESIVEYIPAVYQHSLSESSEDIIVVGDEITTDKYSGREDGDEAANTAIELEMLLLDLTLSIHSQSRGFRTSTSFKPLVGCWKEVCVIAFGLSSEDHTRYLSQILIEIALVDLDDRRRALPVNEWGDIIAGIQFYGSQDVVSTAFSEIRAHLEAQRTSGSYQSVSEKGGELELFDANISSSYNEIEEIIDDLQNQSKKSHEELVWENNDINNIRQVIRLNPELVGLDPSQSRFLPRRIRGQLRLSGREQLVSRSIGKDSLVMMNTDGQVVFIKLVQSIEREDLGNIDQVRREVYNQVRNYYPAVYGPHPFKTLIVTPNADKTIINYFEKERIEIKEVKSQDLISNGLVRQTTLDEFLQKSPKTYSSNLI